MWVGLLVIAAGAAVLALEVEGWNTAWFLFAWIGWLLFVDGWIARAGGASFVRDRPRELGALLVWSVPFWCIFEAYNLVIDNWTYVFLPRSEAVQAGFAGLAFATVLPACFFHAALLDALGWDPRGRPVRVRGPVEWGVGGFGALCVVLPLVWPRLCFWMVWGALLGVPAVLTYRLGAPSLLRDLEEGRWGRPVRLFVGGVVAGGLWEGLNYGARTKWVYTVPGFEEWKLFEMPLLGFVGFPFLALSAFEAYSLWCHVARAGRTWEQADRGQPAVGRRGEMLQIAALVAFSAAADRLPLDPAVLSRRPLLTEIDGLGPDDRARLESEGIRTPEQLVRFGDAPEAAMDHARMALHKGMGAEHARLVLAETGGFAGLGAADPDALHAALARRAGEAGVRPPTVAQVKVWIRAVSGDHGRR
ncbi:MAG: helix-hairpin-helix domain-containing protein [Myxococcota bacterium]